MNHYGHIDDQGLNASISQAVANAYGAALSYLLDDPLHHVYMGDTTIVFWSEHQDNENSSLFYALIGDCPLDGVTDAKGTDALISGIMSNLSRGRHVNADVDIDAKFYVLGLAPASGSRISVRFFMQNTFGNMLHNTWKHYSQQRLVHALGKRDYIAPRYLLGAGDRDLDKLTFSSKLSASLLRAILLGGRYPDALYQNTLLRIHATQDVSYERASIIKMWLLRNTQREKETITVELNEDNVSTAYSLGRVFAVLEQIQEKANGSVTITTSYLSSACTTPVVVFPRLLDLSIKHQAKIAKTKPRLARYYSNLLTNLLGPNRVREFPKHLALGEQGEFFLGYYHQRQKHSNVRASEQADNVDEQN